MKRQKQTYKLLKEVYYMCWNQKFIHLKGGGWASSLCMLYSSRRYLITGQRLYATLHM